MTKYPEPGLPGRFKSPRLVLALSLMFSVAAAVAIQGIQAQRVSARFEREVARALDSLGDRIDASEEVLRGLDGLHRASGGIDQRSFTDYLAALHTWDRYPGLLGITYGFRVGARERTAFVARMRRETQDMGLPEPFAIFPVPSGPESFVVAYGEPASANLKAIGYDTSSNPEQRVSLEEARDNMALVASAPMPVMQDPTGQAGLILRLPLYRKGLPLDTVSQRRAAFAAYANAVFRVQDLFRSSLWEQLQNSLWIRAEDAGHWENEPRAASARALLFSEGQGATPRNFYRCLPTVLRPVLEGERELRVGGRRWILHFGAKPGFYGAQEGFLALAGLLGGVCLSILLYAFLENLDRTGRRARELALRMTDQLRRSESRLRAITRVIPDLILVIDEDGRCMEVYTGDEERLPVPREALLGRSMRECWPEGAARAVLGAVRRALQSGETVAVEYALEAPRSTLWMDARMTAMDLARDGKRCVLCVNRDITERRREEERLRQSQKLESLGILAGGIAHDFNNLLTAIQGNLDLALLGLDEKAYTAPYLNRIAATVHRASELTRQMLAYSGRGRFLIQPLDLNGIVREMADLLSVSISKRVGLDFRLSEGLPRIEADAAQIQQVVMNLVTNASEAIGDTEGRILLATACEALGEEDIDAILEHQGLVPGPYVTLEVRDTGCGMGPELLERIFDPFFTTKSTGRGLGLSAMQGILRGHRAGIRIQSEPGKGSSFKLYLPACPSDRALPGDEIRDPTDPGVFQGTVLLVDDEPDIRAAASELIALLGMRVLEAGDGVEAVEVFKAHAAEIRVVLMDLTLPRMGGNQAVQAIRELEPDVPVIFCSGFSRQEIQEPSVGAGPVGFIQKPFRFRELRAALQKALQQGREKAE